MSLRIEIEVRNVYGEEKAYPVNHQAQCAAQLAGTKTLTRHALRCLLGMGATIAVMCRGVVVSEYSGVESAQRLPVPA